MAVTTHGFDELAPVPYAKVRGELRTGDILLFHSSDLGARAIEFFTNSLWCHAAFVLVLKDIDRIFILESVDKIGVRMMPISLKINGIPDRPDPYPGKLLLARYNGFPSDDNARIGEMTKVALDRLGYPYSVAELAARVRALLRRSNGVAPPRQIELGDVKIDLDARRVFVATTAVDFTPKEFAIVAFLAEHSPRTFSREALLEHVWGSMSEWQDEATVTEHVRRARVKLAAAGCTSNPIDTVRGYGYRIALPAGPT